MSERILLQGNEACALGAIRAGCRFYAGYPITPSSEIAEVMARELPKIGGVFIQMEDELASAAAIIGASLAGVKAMTATSGPGFSLMQEAIGYACMAETPVVFVDVQRGGPSTGLPTRPGQGDIMQARWGTHGDHPIITLYPSTVEEVYELIIEAFNLAEEFRNPVIFLMDEVLGHIRESVTLPPDEDIEIISRKSDEEFEEAEEIFLPFEERENVEVIPLAKMGKTRFHVTGLVHDESGFPVGTSNIAGKLLRRLENKIRLHADRIIKYEEFMVKDAEILVIAYGSVARSALRAVKMARLDDIPVGLFRPITIWPFPFKRLKELSKHISGVVVAEMNLGQVAREVSRVFKSRQHFELVSRVDGELISPSEILDAITKMYAGMTEF
ncbi:MAG: 2-oxoacid:acceptor oxidoreductase subunit alpha [Thermotogae bacterium]|nr:2-oxoacid:acceptor oxidoreductase subunit alpha [Thermotogota bacterium]